MRWALMFVLSNTSPTTGYIYKKSSAKAKVKAGVSRLLQLGTPKYSYYAFVRSIFGTES